MDVHGRAPELGRLRGALDRRRASVVRVSGLRGGGKTALVRRALTDYGALVHEAPPLPDDRQRRLLGDAVRRARADRGLTAEPRPGLDGEHTTSSTWPELLGGALELAAPEERPFVVVLDDVHRLAEARAPWLAAVLRTIERAREAQRPLHVVVIGPDHAMPSDEDLGELGGDVIRVGPLPFRAASALLPGSRPADLLRAYAIFGGIPRVLTALDRSVTVGTNIRRLVLQSDGMLADFGGTWLERDVQAPARYYALLATLADGEADWSTLHRGVPDLTRSGQVAPYLRRLEELGLVRVRRSLDAAPTARSARYAVADPFIAFWTRFVLDPARPGADEAGGDFYSAAVRPRLDDHVRRFFQLICRQHMTHDAMETLGANAREGGSLWGAGYEIPVAGLLTSGAAYYGSCHWGPLLETDRPLEALDRQIRETRYGFGREARLRILFTPQGAPGWLQREVARRHDADIVDAKGLVGSD